MGDLQAIAWARSEPAGLRVTMLATLWFVLLAAAATAPALFGSRSLGPDALLDTDPLYARGPPPPVAIFDATRVFYDLPRDFAAADGVRHGRLDLWNPRAGFGMPLWGEGGGPLFPTRIPFYIAPSRRMYDLVTALRLVIAGLGAFLLARQRGLAPVPAAATGGLFELSGAIMATLPFGELTPPCLLPWVLFGAELIAQRRSAQAVAATGLALGATGNSGHPMFVVVVFAGLGAAACGHVLAAWRRPRMALTIGALATLAVVLGLAIAAPALLPVRQSLAVGRLYKSTGMYSLQSHWYRAQVRGALPIALFAPATLVSLGFHPSFVAPAVGLFGLVLAVAGWLRRGLDAPLIAVGLVGVGLTLAPPLLASVGRLPLLQYVYPMYGWSLVALPLTQAAGRGAEALAMRRGLWTLLAALIIVLAGASSLLHLQDIAPRSFLAFPVRQMFVDSFGDWTGWLRLVLPLTLVPLIVGALVAGAWTRFGERCAIAATALAALELLVSVAPLISMPASTVLEATPSPAVRFLQHSLSGDQYRMLSPRSVGVPATPSLFGLTDARGAATIPAERYVRYLEAIVPKASWYVWQFPNDVLRHPLLDLGGVRYVVRPVVPAGEPEPFLEGDAALHLVYRDERVAIYENDASLPRARIVHATVAVRDREEAFQRLREAAATGSHAAAAGLASRVFVEPSADGDPVPQGPAALPLSSEDVRIVAGNDPDRVELQASLTLPGWVVLADTFYPGWTATVDGVAAPIHPTDLLFRGVFVPPGTHRIALRYQPRPFRFGLALSVLGLAISAFLIVRGRRV